MIETNTMVGTGMKIICRREELTQRLGVVARAVSTRASVQILSGVLLRAEAGQLHLAATDMELSLRASLDAQVEGDGAVVVPGRLLVDLVRLLPESEVTLEHRAEENVLHITSGPSTSTLHTYAAEDVWWTTRRIDGQVPNYKQLLPEAFEHEVTLPRNEALDVVRRVGVMVQRTSPIQLRFADGELTVFARTQDVGEAKESLPVQFSGDPLEIGFNAEFLREGIETMAEDEIRLRLISPLRPAVIEGGADDPTYLIMPIRLPG